MKIYMASSWKNVDLVRDIADLLRNAGHEVDDFTDSSRGRFVFHYSELGDVSKLDAINFLQDERSQKAFREDRKWIDWSDCVVMVLPCGKSAHLEAGYAKGKGKLLAIYQQVFPKGEFDVMYGFADLITDSLGDLVDFLKT